MLSSTLVIKKENYGTKSFFFLFFERIEKLTCLFILLDTCHRMLLGALLLASKFLQDTEWAPTYTHSNAITKAEPELLGASWARYYGYANSYYVGPITNRRLCDMCGGLFTLDDINMLERAFLKLIQHQCWVDEKDVYDYVEKHRVDLAL